MVAVSLGLWNFGMTKEQLAQEHFKKVHTHLCADEKELEYWFKPGNSKTIDGFIAGFEVFEERLKIAMEFIDKVAGPIGSGCEIGSLQHMAQVVREQIKGKI